MELTRIGKVFVRSLFEQAEEILRNDYYRQLKDEDFFYSKVVGVTFDGRQEVIKAIQDGEPIELVREPENIHDRNAIKVVDMKGRQLGYLKKEMAYYLGPEMDRGVDFLCHVSEVTGKDKETLGVNLFVQRKDYIESQELQAGMDERRRLEALPEEELLQEIRGFLVGKYDYREKQKESLDRLFEGKNTLTIMGTGRGKSLIFQSFASYQAIRKKKVTIILYPLRALANDQYDALKRKLTPIGLRVLKANGSISEFERERVSQSMASGEVDIILTTPEFLEYHMPKFQKIKDRIGLFVVDEAHHIGTDSAVFRPSYAKLGKLLADLGNPLTIAVTATANNEVADQIINTLNIQELVIDAAVRENLVIKDLRGRYQSPKKNQDIPLEKRKESYIADLIRQGVKVLAYVNSREKSITIAEELREICPEYADEICFYNAGLTSKERNIIEDLFRNGEVKCVVSTSAFGEGIDNPDIRHVVHYHMNMSFTDFNQQSGRAGRDGQKSTIHLLFGSDDDRLNEFILESAIPDRDYVAEVYKIINYLSRSGKVTNSNDEISEILKGKNEKIRTSEERVAASIAIMQELGLLEILKEGQERTLILLPSEGKSFNINASAIYAEGQEEIRAYRQFAAQVLSESRQELLSRINKPIYPQMSLFEKQAS